MNENIKIIELRTQNIRELSKKERLYGLNLKSWYLVCMIPITLQAWISFLSMLLLFVFLVAFFYIAEFFDCDITDIFLSQIVLKHPSSHYWA